MTLTKTWKIFGHLFGFVTHANEEWKLLFSDIANDVHGDESGTSPRIVELAIKEGVDRVKCITLGSF